MKSPPASTTPLSHSGRSSPTRWANGVPPSRWVWNKFICDQCGKDCGYSQNLGLHRKRSHGLTHRQRFLGPLQNIPRGEGGEEEGAPPPPDLGSARTPRNAAVPTAGYAARRAVVSAGGGLVKAMPCKACPACLRPDCGACVHCLDKKQFGGPGKLKRRCKKRKCESPKVTKIIKSNKNNF